MQSLTQGRQAGMGKPKSELEIEVLIHGAVVGKRAAWVNCMVTRRNPVGRPILQHLGRQMHLNQSNHPDRFLGFLA